MAFVQSAQKGRAAATAHPNADMSSAPVQGNLLVAFVAQQNTGSTLTANTGWTALTATANGDAGRMFYKVAGASEGTNQQPCTTSHTARAWVCLIVEHSGIDPTPLDVENAVGDAGSTKTSPTVNPTSTGAVVVIGAAYSTSASTTFSNQMVNSSATGVSERGDLGDGSGNNQTSGTIWDFSQATAAASYATTVGASVAEAGGIHIAVFKASSGTQYPQAVSGSLSFAGDITKRTSRAIAASLGFTGAIARLTARSLSATLGFSGQTNKQTNRNLSGAVTFTASSSKLTSRQTTATVTFSTSFTPELLAPGTPALVIIHIHTE